MSDFRTDSQIVKAASALELHENAPNDWSLILWSSARSTKVTIIQLSGTSAEADIQVYYQLFKVLAEASMNLHW